MMQLVGCSPLSNWLWAQSDKDHIIRSMVEAAGAMYDFQYGRRE
jgi:hypothetical protein